MSVTYYLGAGASANVIPCVADLSKEIREMAVFIKENVFHQSVSYCFNGMKYNIDTKNERSVDRAINIIENFCTELDGQLSIDTLAKIYWIQNDGYKLKILKSVLFASLIFWERKGVDHRYLNFWATITSVHSVLSKDRPGFVDYPGTMNVLSWNYDCQMERSFKRVFPEGESIWDEHGQNNGKSIFRHTGVNFRKLNGSASMPEDFLIDSPGFSARGLYDMTGFQMAYFIVDVIADQQNRFEGQIEMLKFCWEHEPSSMVPGRRFNDNFYKVDTTETLVVIGYTFPSINHQLDSRLLRIMKNLKQVYFQGKNRSDAERIRDYFQAVVPANFGEMALLPIDSNGFFMPPQVTSEIEDIRIKWGRD